MGNWCSPNEDDKNTPGSISIDFVRPNKVREAETVPNPKSEIIDPNLKVIAEGEEYQKVDNENELNLPVAEIFKRVGPYVKMEKLAGKKGPFKYKDGSTYVGQINGNGMKDGFGKLVFSDGSIVYEGCFTNDKMTGRGRIIWPDKSFYVGDFINGMWTGNGQITRNDGYFYTGAWKNNRQEGYGQERTPGNNVAEGQFNNGVKNGKWTVRSPDGRVMVGNFVNGILEGEVKVTPKGGETQIVIYKNGRPLEPGA